MVGFTIKLTKSYDAQNCQKMDSEMYVVLILQKYFNSIAAQNIQLLYGKSKMQKVAVTLFFIKQVRELVVCDSSSHKFELETN